MRLLESVTLGTRSTRNRLVFGPHETNLADGRGMSAAHVAYYERRAVGGAGLIVTEEASVHRLDWPYERCPLALDCGPGWEAVAQACQPHGALVVAALGHAGMQGTSAYSQREVMAPSRVPDAVTRELPKEMEANDVDEIIKGFANAARIAMGAGMDGVEINVGQFSLLRQFVSGLTNQRGDDWGLGNNGGFRLISTIIERVRMMTNGGRNQDGDTKAGDRKQGIVGLRLSCDELAPWAGLTPESAADLAAQLAPLVDYLVVVRGSIYSADATRPDSHVPAGFNLDLVKGIRDAVAGTTQVTAQGSIVEWGQAEWAVDDGRADLVEMTRAQIADPDIGVRLAEGTQDRIRPCVLCNQKCNVRDGRNPIVSCTVNPTTGYEASEIQVAPPGPSQQLMIVGAGPAGMEAARVAANAGHKVEIFEQSGSVGGLVPSWSKAAGRQQLGNIVQWLDNELQHLGVIVHFNVTVDAAQVKTWQEQGHHVILATGSAERSVEYAVANDATVVTGQAFLDGSAAALPDGPVAIWDPIGGPIGISLAESLAHERPVVLLTPDQIAGTLLSLTGDLASASTRLLQQGVTIRKYALLRSVQAGSVEVEDRYTGTRETLDIAAVIDAGHRLPNHALWLETGQQVDMAGDAVAPRTIYEAMLEGRRLALTLTAPSLATPSTNRAGAH